MAYKSYEDAQPHSGLELVVDRSGNLEPVRYDLDSGLEVMPDRSQGDLEVVHDYPATGHSSNHSGIQQRESRPQS